MVSLVKINKNNNCNYNIILTIRIIFYIKIRTPCNNLHITPNTVLKMCCWINYA